MNDFVLLIIGMCSLIGFCSFVYQISETFLNLIWKKEKEKEKEIKTMEQLKNETYSGKMY